MEELQGHVATSSRSRNVNRGPLGWKPPCLALQGPRRTRGVAPGVAPPTHQPREAGSSQRVSTRESPCQQNAYIQGHSLFPKGIPLGSREHVCSLCYPRTVSVQRAGYPSSWSSLCPQHLAWCIDAQRVSSSGAFKNKISEPSRRPSDPGWS